ncbi:hypothetical protein OAN22_00485 [Alphaproteobacteria bacterium]|nr:hypothetical protein [Alphaproteobacteria bacterium]
MDDLFDYIQGQEYRSQEGFGLQVSPAFLHKLATTSHAMTGNEWLTLFEDDAATQPFGVALKPHLIEALRKDPKAYYGGESRTGLQHLMNILINPVPNVSLVGINFDHWMKWLGAWADANGIDPNGDDVAQFATMVNGYVKESLMITTVSSQFNRCMQAILPEMHQLLVSFVDWEDVTPEKQQKFWENIVKTHATNAGIFAKQYAKALADVRGSISQKTWDQTVRYIDHNAGGNNLSAFDQLMTTFPDFARDANAFTLLSETRATVDSFITVLPTTVQENMRGSAQETKEHFAQQIAAKKAAKEAEEAGATHDTE